MSDPESQEEVNQLPPSTDQTSPARSVSFSTPGGTPAGTQSPPAHAASANLQTPPPTRSGVMSPLPDLAQTPHRIDLTPEGVERNFLQLRSLLNQYVMRERDKGVRLRLDYDEEEEISLSPIPPPPLTATYGRRPSPRNNNAGPSNTHTASHYEARSSPCLLYTSPSPRDS